jgi:DNA recombination protein RmuC
MSVFLLSCVIALVAGAVLGWLGASVRKTAELRRRETAAAERSRREAAELQRALAERDLARQERARSDQAVADARLRLEGEQRARTAAETRLAENERLLNEQRGFIEGSRKQLEDSFTALAQQTLRTVGESLIVQNKTQLEGSRGDIVQSLDTKRAEIETMLKPLRDMLEAYRGELTKSEHTRNEVYGGLREQIRSLLSLQEAAHRETSRLANVFQSPTVRGEWGEYSLRRCMEMSGMSAYCDFVLQETITSDDGRRLRPDCIVRLPNKRLIAIDSKAPLADYGAAAESNSDERKRELLILHAKTIRRHIDSLSRKEYQSSIGDSLDFTVMFIPGEHFLSAALVSDPELFEYAVSKKIYLASPTILLPLLRAIEASWKAEQTEENARKIQAVGQQLFERFVKVMEHITGVGRVLNQAVAKYNEAIGSIDSRLWPKGEELQRLTGTGKDLGGLEQLSLIANESTKFRLTMQNEDEVMAGPVEISLVRERSE